MNQPLKPRPEALFSAEYAQIYEETGGGEPRPESGEISPPGADEAAAVPEPPPKEWVEPPEATEPPVGVESETEADSPEVEQKGPLKPFHCGWNDGPKSRRTGLPCRAMAKANGRCRFHGGNALRGGASARYKHGGYSKYLPKGLGRRYEEALNDPDLLSAREELALLRTRLGQLTERLKEGGSAKLWTKGQSALDSVHAAIRAGDSTGMQSGLTELTAIFATGLKTEGAWAELYEAVEMKTKVAEREHRRLRDLRQYMTVQQAMDLMGYILAVLIKRVPDKKQLGLIHRDLDRVLTVRPGDGNKIIDESLIQPK